MFNINELVGKRLTDVKKNSDLGEIVDISWDKPSGRCVIETDEGAYTCEKVIRANDTVNVDASESAKKGEKLIDKLVYDTTGKLLGKVVNAEFGKTLKLAKIHLEDGSTYTKGKVYAVKDVLLIRVPLPGKVKKSPPKVSKVAVATLATPDNQTSVKKSVGARWQQNRKYGDFSFLIGKVADKNITNFQGEVMIKNGERVTHDILRQAKISGKLIELCLHTK